MNDMFRDAGDLLAHIEDTIRTEGAAMRIKIFSSTNTGKIEYDFQQWIMKHGHGITIQDRQFSTVLDTASELVVYSVLVSYIEHGGYELEEQSQEEFHIGDYAQVITPESAYEGMIGEVKSVHPIMLHIAGSDDVFDIGPFDAIELAHVDKPSSEDRLERQAQAHLEAAALHRDDPMF